LRAQVMFTVADASVILVAFPVLTVGGSNVAN